MLNEDKIGREFGPYKILDELGAGGMGVVYKAHEGPLNRLVALKLLAGHLARDPEFLARFQREAQSAAQINHPNVVHVYNLGKVGSDWYIAMEFVKGETVAHALSGREALPLRRALEIVAQAADALHAAHELGIIHRDIKPQNLMLDGAGRVKVMDFGIAKPIGGETGKLTATGGILGTPEYMSPEQCMGEELDARSDIFSLGVVLFQMLTGQIPHPGKTPLQVIRRRCQEPVPSLAEVRPDLPPEITEVADRALALDPGDRFDSAAEFAESLGAILDSPQILGPKAGATPRPAPRPNAFSEELETLPPRPRANPSTPRQATDPQIRATTPLPRPARAETPPPLPRAATPPSLARAATPPPLPQAATPPRLRREAGEAAPTPPPSPKRGGIAIPAALAGLTLLALAGGAGFVVLKSGENDSGSKLASLPSPTPVSTALAATQPPAESPTPLPTRATEPASPTPEPPLEIRVVAGPRDGDIVKTREAIFAWEPTRASDGARYTIALNNAEAKPLEANTASVELSGHGEQRVRIAMLHGSGAEIAAVERKFVYAPNLPPTLAAQLEKDSIDEGAPIRLIAKADDPEEKGAEIWYSINDGERIKLVEGSALKPLEPGRHKIDVVAIDPEGNESDPFRSEFEVKPKGKPKPPVVASATPTPKPRPEPSIDYASLLSKKESEIASFRQRLQAGEREHIQAKQRLARARQEMEASQAGSNNELAEIAENIIGDIFDKKNKHRSGRAPKADPGRAAAAQQEANEASARLAELRAEIPRLSAALSSAQRDYSALATEAASKGAKVRESQAALAPYRFSDPELASLAAPIPAARARPASSVGGAAGSGEARTEEMRKRLEEIKGTTVK